MTATPRLPPGIRLAGLGARLGAYLLDAVPVAIAYGAAGAVWYLGVGMTVQLVVSIAAAVIALGWGIFVWSRLATTGRSPGMTITKVELIGYRNGKPLGWGKVLGRYLIFAVIGATGIGLIVLIIVMVLNPLRQGWHDLAVGSIMIEARQRVVKSAASVGADVRPRPSGVATVGLPSHLQTSSNDSFAPPRVPVPQPAQQPGPPPGGYSSPASHPSPGDRPGAQPQRPTGWDGGFAGFGGPAGQSPPGSTPGTTSPGTTNPGVINGLPSAWAPTEDRPARAREESSPLEVGDSTRLVPKRGVPARSQGEGWVIALDDGRQVPVAGLVLIGRDPAPRPGEEVGELVAVTDNSRMVSKTHIAVGVDNKGVYVMDRGSTNGTAIAAGGKFEPCPAGELVRVREGQIISFGDHRLEIRRTYV